MHHQFFTTITASVNSREKHHQFLCLLSSSPFGQIVLHQSGDRFILFRITFWRLKFSKLYFKYSFQSNKVEVHIFIIAEIRCWIRLKKIPVEHFSSYKKEFVFDSPVTLIYPKNQCDWISQFLSEGKVTAHNWCWYQTYVSQCYTMYSHSLVWDGICESYAEFVTFCAAAYKSPYLYRQAQYSNWLYEKIGTEQFRSS